MPGRCPSRSALLRPVLCLLSWFVYSYLSLPVGVVGVQLEGSFESVAMAFEALFEILKGRGRQDCTREVVVPADAVAVIIGTLYCWVAACMGRGRREESGALTTATAYCLCLS